MMFRIEPLYYSEGQYEKMNIEEYLSSYFLVSISIGEHAFSSLFTTQGSYIITKERALEILQILECDHEKR